MAPAELGLNTNHWISYRSLLLIFFWPNLPTNFDLQLQESFENKLQLPTFLPDYKDNVPRSKPLSSAVQSFHYNSFHSISLLGAFCLRIRFTRHCFIDRKQESLWSCLAPENLSLGSSLPGPGSPPVRTASTTADLPNCLLPSHQSNISLQHHLAIKSTNKILTFLSLKAQNVPYFVSRLRDSRHQSDILVIHF